MKLARLAFVASTGSMFAVAIFMPRLFVFAFIAWLVAGVMVMPEGER